MPIEIYKSDFGITWVNYDTHDMFRSSWMKLDDDTNSPGRSAHCGSSCTRHEFTLKSRVAQTVIVAASAWQDRGYPNECKSGATRGSKRHIVNVEGQGTKAFNAGTIMLDPFTMEAGEERSIYIEMDYNRQHMAKDVSIVAWGDEGDICIEHKGGIESDKFPQLSERKKEKQDDSDDDEPESSSESSSEPDESDDDQDEGDSDDEESKDEDEESEDEEEDEDDDDEPVGPCPTSGTVCRLYEKRRDHMPMPGYVVMGTKDAKACMSQCKNAMGGHSEVALADGKFNGTKVTSGEWFGCPELEYMLLMSDDGRAQIVDFDYCDWRDGF